MDCISNWWQPSSPPRSRAAAACWCPMIVCRSIFVCCHSATQDCATKRLVHVHIPTGSSVKFDCFRQHSILPSTTPQMNFLFPVGSTLMPDSSTGQAASARASPETGLGLGSPSTWGVSRVLSFWTIVIDICLGLPKSTELFFCL